MAGRERTPEMTLAERVRELRELAERRGVAGQVGDIPDSRLAAQAYADVLGLDVLLVTNLNITLKQIQELSNG